MCCSMEHLSSKALGLIPTPTRNDNKPCTLMQASIPLLRIYSATSLAGVHSTKSHYTGQAGPELRLPRAGIAGVPTSLCFTLLFTLLQARNTNVHAHRAQPSRGGPCLILSTQSC